MWAVSVMASNGRLLMAQTHPRTRSLVDAWANALPESESTVAPRRDRHFGHGTAAWLQGRYRLTLHCCLAWYCANLADSN